MLSGGASVSHLAVLYQTFTCLCESIVTGFMRISFGNKTQSSHLYRSRNSPRCCSMPALYCINGVMIMNKLSIPSCNIKPESPFAVQSC